MNDIQKALLGDKEAQERLTERGKLLPCPFCGGHASVRAHFSSYGESYSVKCENKCVVTCGHFVAPEIEWRVTLKNEAIAKWNTRAPILSAEELERLEANHDE